MVCRIFCFSFRFCARSLARLFVRSIVRSLACGLFLVCKSFHKITVSNYVGTLATTRAASQAQAQAGVLVCFVFHCSSDYKHDTTQHNTTTNHQTKQRLLHLALSHVQLLFLSLTSIRTKSPPKKSKTPKHKKGTQNTFLSFSLSLFHNLFRLFISWSALLILLRFAILRFSRAVS